jgi:hypothetical protein
MKPTEPPKKLRKGHRRCTQVQCGFYRSGHCQTCEKGHDCNARPYEINESCTACLDCEGRPGFLRFGHESEEQDIKEANRPQDIILIYNNKPSKEHIRQEKELMR